MRGGAAVHPDLPEVSARWVRLVRWYAPRFVRKHFSAVRLLGEAPAWPGDEPLLIVLNHPSWWDPMAVAVLIERFFRDRQNFGPIDGAGLEKYRFMEKLGFFGIDLSSRAGAAKFLRVGRAVLATPGGVLWVTAEGHFTDPRRRPVLLRPGVAHLLRKAVQVTVVPLAIEYPFGQEKQPEMRLAFGDLMRVDASRDPERSVAEWNAMLEAGLTATMERLAAATIAAGPGGAEGFTTLLDGRRGVGGVYDLWRKLRAKLTGRAFTAAHQADQHDKVSEASESRGGAA